MRLSRSFLTYIHLDICHRRVCITRLILTPMSAREKIVRRALSPLSFVFRNDKCYMLRKKEHNEI